MNLELKPSRLALSLIFLASLPAWTSAADAIQSRRRDRGIGFVPV